MGVGEKIIYASWKSKGILYQELFDPEQSAIGQGYNEQLACQNDSVEENAFLWLRKSTGDFAACEGLYPCYK